jgi:hypothetical protein
LLSSFALRGRNGLRLFALLHDWIFQIAGFAFEDVVVVRLLPEHLLQPHLAGANRAGWYLNLGVRSRHGSAPSANAELIGFMLWLGVAG